MLVYLFGKKSDLKMDSRVGQGLIIGENKQQENIHGWILGMWNKERCYNLVADL